MSNNRIGENEFIDRKGPLIAKKHTLAKRFSFTISAATSCVSLAPHPIAFYFFPSLIFSHRSRNLRCAATSHTYTSTFRVYASMYRPLCVSLCATQQSVHSPRDNGRAYLTWRAREHPQKGPRFLTFIHIGPPVSWATLMALHRAGTKSRRTCATGKGKRKSFQPFRIIFRWVSQVRERLHRANYASP